MLAPNLSVKAALQAKPAYSLIASEGHIAIPMPVVGLI